MQFISLSLISLSKRTCHVIEQNKHLSWGIMMSLFRKITNRIIASLRQEKVVSKQEICKVKCSRENPGNEDGEMLILLFGHLRFNDITSFLVRKRLNYYAT